MKDQFQTMMYAMSAQWKAERAASQMTLGEMILTLKSLPPDLQIANINHPHSYRGYYSDLAFEQGDGTRAVAEVLSDCLESLGKVFYGYKGGDFVMDKTTPMWIAYHGSCGEKLMGINEDGTLVTEDDD